MIRTQLRQLPAYARTANELRRFLRSPVSPPVAEQRVAEAISLRRDRLLVLLQHGIYGHPRSPYRALLQHAGIEYGDAQELIDREGVDGAVSCLASQGVYVTLDEFKGRLPIRRGSLELPIETFTFGVPRQGAGLAVRTGATRSSGTPSLIRFDDLVEVANHRSVMHQGWGHNQGSLAIWFPILPGSAGFANILIYAKQGRPPERWFSHAPVTKGRDNPGAWQTHALLRTGRLFMSGFPSPEYVPLSDAERVADWMIDRLRRGNRCQVVTYVSSAMRVCAAAISAGASLEGALFVVLGEPLTESRANTIRASGAEVTSTYSSTETGTIADGCADPIAPDDVHLLLDRAVAIRHPMPAGGRTVDGLLLTKLSPTASTIMLNVEAGDTGQIVERTCACPYGVLGYSQHLHSITSYEKLTGEGMTYDASALAAAIEAVLPARFGGSSTDYQAYEELEDNHLVRLTLLVSPRLGPIDDDDLVATLRAEMQRGAAGHRLADLIWEQAGFLRVRRAEPISTARGKLLPFQVARPLDSANDR